MLTTQGVRVLATCELVTPSRTCYGEELALHRQQTLCIFGCKGRIPITPVATDLVFESNATAEDVHFPMERLIVKFQAVRTKAVLCVLEAELVSPIPEGLELPGSISLRGVFDRQNDGYTPHVGSLN